MKKLRKLAVILLFVIFIFCSAGCAKILQKLDNKEIRGYTELMIDSVINNDIDSAYSLMDDVCTEEDFVAVFRRLNEVFSDIDSYELSLLSIYNNSNFADGSAINTITATYKMTTGIGDFVVDVETNSQYEKLSYFNINYYEKTDYYFTGTFKTLNEANIVQWAFLLLNLPVVIFAVIALVDCCRKTIKYKPLWILIILFGFLTLGATIGDMRFNLNFHFGWLLNYSACVIDGSGTTTLRLMLPVGGILYFILRKRLIPKNENLQQSPIITDEILFDDNASNNTFFSEHIWNEYKIGSLKTAINKAEVLRITDADGFINIVARAGDNNIDYSISNDSVYMYCFNTDNEKTVDFSDIKDYDDFISIINDFASVNT